MAPAMSELERVMEPRHGRESRCWGDEGPGEGAGFGGSEHHLNWHHTGAVQRDGEQPPEQPKAKWLWGPSV